MLILKIIHIKYNSNKLNHYLAPLDCEVELAGPFLYSETERSKAETHPDQRQSRRPQSGHGDRTSQKKKKRVRKLGNLKTKDCAECTAI